MKLAAPSASREELARATGKPQLRPASGSFASPGPAAQHAVGTRDRRGGRPRALTELGTRIVRGHGASGLPPSGRARRARPAPRRGHSATPLTRRASHAPPSPLPPLSPWRFPRSPDL
jgi:hypothetical protein